MVYDSPDVVATPLVDGKLTLIHRRLWPSLARLVEDGRIASARMTKVTQEHTESGRHEKHEEPFPDWMPPGLQLPNAATAMVLLGAPLAASLLRPGGEVPPSPVTG